MSIVFLIGGARSGKSELALRVAAAQHSPVVFVATAQVGDTEMAERIAQHRHDRPASWVTIEEPLHLREAIEEIARDSCVVVDCLTLWTANALERLGAAEVQTHAAAAAAVASEREGMTVVVTNEVGLGIVPENQLGRIYRDLLGRVNAIWAEQATEAYLVVAGCALRLERHL